jgi:3D (Asp-Asp-Asp) domain-containing protein
MKNLILIILTIVLIYFGIKELSKSVTISVQNQDTMLCESARVSGNEDYLAKCACYYQDGDIECLEDNFELQTLENHDPLCELKDVVCEYEKKEFDKEGEFTAYNPIESQTDADPNIMASNKEVYDGAIACPAYYEFGTKIEVEGMGTYTCDDRMGKRYRHKENFDIVLADYDDAVNFGRKQLKYRIVNF